MPERLAPHPDDQRPPNTEFQTSNEDFLSDLADRLDQPFTPTELARQEENRRLLEIVQAALPPVTSETYSAELDETEVAPADVDRFYGVVSEMYQYVTRLIKKQLAGRAETSRIEARDQWDVLQLEHNAYQQKTLRSHEFVAVMRHTYMVLLKIKERCGPKQKA